MEWEWQAVPLQNTQKQYTKYPRIQKPIGKLDGAEVFSVLVIVVSSWASLGIKLIQNKYIFNRRPINFTVKAI